MRTFLIPNIIASTVLSLGLSAALQAAPQRYESPYQADSRGDLRDGQLLFSRVRADIDRAEGDLPSFSNGHFRFDRVRGELSSLQRHWDESTYEPRNADNVILSLNRALDSSGISAGDRDRLAQDLVQLRDFRDNHL